MASGGGARGSKRKRNWDIEHSSFPGERPLQVRRAGPRTAGAAASLSEAWLRCGEGFQDISGTLSLTAEKKTVTEKHLELSPTPKKDELQFIDWEIDSDREDASDCNECEDGEGAVDISDCASCASSHSLTSDERLSELPKPSSTEILEYSSDSEKEDDSENILFIDSESPHKHHTEFGSDARQGVERLTDPRAESTEIILCTPQKWTATFPKTPENSAKKKKLLRGGLAERLNGLQNRERSAISLWRHQCVSYQKTLSGRKSGVLTVRILELHEECTMHVALCEQLAGSSAAGPSRSIGPRPGAHLKVLFTKETAGYLRGRPQDIVYIFPPWQKLTLPDGSCSVILNTYFCQKIVAREDAETTHRVCSRDALLPGRSITLAHMFRIKSLTNKSPEIQVVCGRVAATGTGWTHRCEEAKGHVAALRDALLDVVESPGAGVRVLVQRTYSLPGRDGAPTPLGAPGVRICLLVQDACGMFGEVHLEAAILKGRQLEGKSCSLVGMKVLQKATRGRAAGLFSLIDSLWPPVMPLKAPGHSQPCEEIKTHLPLPAFCYILTAHPALGQIDILEGDPISKLYRPPATRCLREILQTGDLGTRCSFCARVIYQRPQPKSLLLLEQREVWLLVTDTSLQAGHGSDPALPKTLPVCVSPACVLGPEVLEAFTVAAPHTILFRDAVRDQGRVVCVERTVLLLQKPLLCVASGACPCELPGPVTLDRLDPTTPVGAICSVQGTVVGVDESSAFSWPACDQCGSGRLQRRPEARGAFSCGDCSRVVTSPVLKRHLQVFLDCPSRPRCRVKVKLLQRSISCLLSFAACEDGWAPMARFQPEFMKTRSVLWRLLHPPLPALVSPCTSGTAVDPLSSEPWLAALELNWNVAKPTSRISENHQSEPKSYEVKSVLGKEVGLLNCFVESVTTHPRSCVGLEEIKLLSAGRPPWDL
ncbi:DNA repair-scaffolding protein isoform X2 [Lemur catta]|uniref:DNA repair-scaffolding protein isoform X2 n=1 Tax=Lemur catta TaxID=9447 RepID=UPI001E268462|nr:DNA repair-scaffolding protein isoform X2 [Lemur catta]